MVSLSKFKGATVGALLGDCLGLYFEMRSPQGVSRIKDTFNNLDEKSSFYTDDTAMAKSVAASLLERKHVEAKDLAKRFTESYLLEPDRGYGASIGAVFNKLRRTDCSDPFGPASEQFDGKGSYGNGGAMRIFPAALFAPKADAPRLNEIVSTITKVTHSNNDAIDGAILQAFAVQQALNCSDSTLDSFNFLQALKSYMKDVELSRKKSDEKDTDSPPNKRKTRTKVMKSHANSYCGKLECIQDFLQREEVPVDEIEQRLGTDVSALGSVPAAIYAFLRSAQSITGLEDESPFERTIIYAISLGGDTDTIATMAGAIAGAFYGIEAIPDRWQKLCESVDEAHETGEKFFQLYQSKKGNA